MSFDLQEEIQGILDPSKYEIPNEHDISSLDPRSINGLLERAVEALAESTDAIMEPEVFDTYRSLLKYAECLQGAIMNKILDSITSAFQAQVETTLRDVDNEEPQVFMVHKTPLEMYAFLLQWFVSAAEKVKSSGEDDVPAAPTKGRRGRGGKAAMSRNAPRKAWTWEDQIPNTLAVASRVLRLKTQRIWTTTAEKDTFIG